MRTGGGDPVYMYQESSKKITVGMLEYFQMSFQPFIRSLKKIPYLNYFQLGYIKYAEFYI